MNLSGKVSKLIIPLLLLPLLPFLGLGYFALNQISEFQQQKLIQQVETESDVVLTSILFSLSNETNINVSKLLTLLPPVKKEPHSTYYIVNTEGSYLAQSYGMAGWSDVLNLGLTLKNEFEAQEAQSILSGQQGILNHKDTTISYRPIILSGSDSLEPAGFLVHVSTLNSITLESPFIKIFLFLFLMGGVLAGGIWLFYSQSILHPLKRIIQANKEISEGDTNYFQESEIPDNEFGLLMRSRNRMLNALRKSQSYVDNILESMQDPLIVIDLKGIIQSCNQVTTDFSAYSQKELIGQPLSLLLREGVFYQEHDLMEQEGRDYLLQQKMLKPVETTLKTQHGLKKIVSFSASPLKREGRRTDGVVCMLHDVSQRKQMEEDLKKLSSVVEQASDAILITDTQGRIEYVNHSFEFLTQYKSAEVLGRNVSLLKSGKQDESFYKRLWTTIHSGQIFDSEMINKKKDGSLYNEQQVINPIRNESGEIAWFAGIIRDLTAHKEMEEQLRRNYDEFQSLVEKNPEGVLVANQSKVVCFANLAANRFLGEGKPLLGEKLKFNLIFGNTIEVDICVGSGQSLGIGEVRVEPTNWKGESSYLVNIMDITRRKNTEDARVRLESELYQSQKMEALGRLASGIAHDFNNVLTPIIGFTERVRRKLSSESKEVQDLDRVLNAADHAKQLISQILSFSRKSKTINTPVRLKSLIDETLDLLSSTLPANITVRKEYDDTPLIMGDSGLLHQVLMNLCVNASHAMPEGGTLILKLSYLYSDRRKSERGEGSSARVCLSVRDTGSGIEPKTLRHIFDPFFTTKEGAKGSGLGLAMVQNIMKNHKGRVEVQSTVGEGTCFSLYFPELESTTATEKKLQVQGNKEKNTTPETAQQEKHIFFMDDDVMGGVLARTLLEDLGYKVTTCSDNIQALEVFSETPEAFDLLLTDYSMPNMNGVEFSRRIRKVRPDIPTVLCTGHNEVEFGENLEEWGINGLLTKPYNMEEFQQCLSEVLNEFTL